MHWSCFLTRLWCRKFWNLAYLFNQAAFTLWPKSKQKIKYLENERAFEMRQDEMKSVFHHFQKAFVEVNKTIFLGRWWSDFKITLRLYFRNCLTFNFSLQNYCIFLNKMSQFLKIEAALCNKGNNINLLPLLFIVKKGCLNYSLHLSLQWK